MVSIEMGQIRVCFLRSCNTRNFVWGCRYCSKFMKTPNKLRDVSVWKADSEQAHNRYVWQSSIRGCLLTILVLISVIFSAHRLVIIGYYIIIIIYLWNEHTETSSRPFFPFCFVCGEVEEFRKSSLWKIFLHIVQTPDPFMSKWF